MSGRTWGLIIFSVVVLVGAFLLEDILMPFLISAGMAYAFNPLVNRLEKWHMPRTLSVTIVFLVIMLILSLIGFLLVPKLKDQANRFIENLPDYLEYFQRLTDPWLQSIAPEMGELNMDTLKHLLSDHWGSASDFLKNAGKKVFSSSTHIITWVVNLFLTPVLLFYMLRDWNNMCRHVQQQLPQHYRPVIDKIFSEIDTRLGRFIRGQATVMLALGFYYAAGLWLSGLNLALIIGLGAGLVSFVPYLGVISGVLVAGVAMLAQTGDLTPILWVLLVFGIGQVLEQMVLVPLLMGGALGLHPAWIIFAILAGGQLFGFIGVLLALPCAAAISVFVRHGLAYWHKTGFYQGR